MGPVFNRSAAARGRGPLHVGHGGPTLRAFTLVELLVVITIIGILVSILVPAVGAVRKAARNMATGAALTSIGTGLETFKADAKLGGSYPYSQTDYWPGGMPRVRSPYSNADIGISGAGLLVWALSGADLLGTTGFQSVGPATTWGQCTGSTYNAPPASSDLYALYPPNDPRAGQTVYTRSGPYVDISKLKVTRNEAGAGGSVGFAIPEEYRYTGNTHKYPMYMDAFGYPILYWRADPAGRQLADVVPDATNRGVYHFGDNGVLLQTGLAGADENPLVLSKAKVAHALVWGSGLSNNVNTYDPISGNPPPPGTFEGYIWDKAVQAKLWPQRADSYLLVSPGFDGRYGTADDVTNFQHNGQ